MDIHVRRMAKGISSKPKMIVLLKSVASRMLSGRNSDMNVQGLGIEAMDDWQTVATQRNTSTAREVLTSRAVSF
jgi:hypothetical protein